MEERRELEKKIAKLCKYLGRSPWVFHVNSGSCNGCDIEIIGALTPRYDAERFGVKLVGTPRHADILVVTGPITDQSLERVKLVYEHAPLDRHIPVDVFVPGCPPRPEAILYGVVLGLERLIKKIEEGGK